MSDQHQNDPHTALARVPQPPAAPPQASPASPYSDEHTAPHGAAHGAAASVSDAHYRTRSAQSQSGASVSTGRSAAAPAAGPLVPTKKVNTLAVVSFATALLGWSALPFLGTVIAIITGHMARGEIRRTGEEGDTFAVIGLALSWLQVALAVGTIFVVILVFGGFAALMAWLGMSTGGNVGMV